MTFEIKFIDGIKTISAIELARALGVKNIGPTQKANQNRWLSANLLNEKFKKGRDYFLQDQNFFIAGEYGITLSTARQIALSYCRKPKFKANADTVGKELTLLEQAQSDANATNSVKKISHPSKPDLTEGTHETQYMSIEGDDKYWTAWGIARACDIIEEEWNREVRTGVSNAIESFMKKQGYTDIRRTSSGVSAYPTGVWVSWLDCRLKKGDKIEGVFKKLVDGVYAIRDAVGLYPYVRSVFGEEIYPGWVKYENDLGKQPSETKTPIERVKDRLKAISQQTDIKGTENTGSFEKSVHVKEIGEMLNMIILYVGEIKDRLGYG